MEKISKEPYKLYNKIQNYDWGTKNENAFIPKLLDIKIDTDLPYAELWIGAHPKAPSKIMYNGQFISLSELIEKFPVEILGKYVAEKFHNKLPFLFKVLSAAQALSIQMHPTKADAKKLHARDPENYPDDNHKPEIAIALDHLDALVGLKPLKEIQSVLKSYDCFETFYGIHFFREVTDSVNTEEESLIKKGLYEKTMKLGEDKEKLAELLDEIECQLLKKEKRELFEEYFLENRKIFGNDVGLLSFFFFNLLSLKKDEGFFTDAGIPHAYLKGNIVECMANSDNVIRAGLTPKFKDVGTLLSLINVDASKPEIITGKGHKIKYNTGAEEFELTKFLLRNEEKIKITTANRVQIGFVLNGEVVISDGMPKKFNFIKGEAFLIPSIVAEYSLVSRNDSSCLLINVP